MKSKEIKTKRLTLRPICAQDKADLIRILSDPRVGETYMVPDMSSEEMRELIFRRFCEEDRFIYGVYLDDRLIGFIHEVCVKDKSIELGYVTDPNEKNNGYASEALAAATDELFSKGYEEVLAAAFEENKASLRVMEKCGMSRTGITEDIEYRGVMRKCIYMNIKNDGKV